MQVRRLTQNVSAFPNIGYSHSIEKDIKKSAYYDREDDNEVDVDELKEKAMNFEDMELSSHVAEGGG